jgi:WD40 repeat protein
MLSRLFLLISTCLILGFPKSVSSQESYAPITPENADQLTVVDRVESTFAGDFTWSSDGQWLAVGTSHDGVKVFAGNAPGAPPLQLDGGLDVLFSPNSDWIASRGSLWDIVSQRALFTYGETVYHAFSPRGTYLLAASHSDGETTITLHSVPSGEVVNTFAVNTPIAPTKAFFSDDETRFALIFESESYFLLGPTFVQIYDTLSAVPISEFETDYATVEFVAFGNINQYMTIYTTSYDYAGTSYTLQLWDVSRQTLLQQFDGFATSNTVRLSPDQNWVYFQDIYNDGNVKLLSVNTGDLIWLTNNRAQRSIQIYNDTRLPAFSPNGRWLAAPYSQFAGDVSDYGIVTWQLAPANRTVSPQRLLVQDTSFSGGIHDLILSPDEETVAVRYADTVYLWDIEAGVVRRSLPTTGRSLRFSSDGSLLFVRASDGEQTWDVETGTLLNTVDHSINGLHSPDGGRVAAITPDKLQMLNIVTGAETTQSVLDDYLGPVVQFDSQNGLVAFQDHQLHLRSLDGQQPPMTLDAPMPTRFTLSPDGSQIAIRVRSAEDRNKVDVALYTINGEDDEPVMLDGSFGSSTLNRITFNPNADRVLLIESQRVNADGDLAPKTTYRLFDTQAGDALATWEQDVWLLYRMATIAAFSPDGHYVLTGGASLDNGGILQIWELSTLIEEPETGSLTELTFYGGPQVLLAEPTFNADGTQLAMTIDDAALGDGVSHDYSVTLMDWADVVDAEPETSIYDIAIAEIRRSYQPQFTSNGDYLLTTVDMSFDVLGGTDLILHDAHTGEALHTLEQHYGGVFHPTGNLLGAIGYDGDIAIWSIDDLISGRAMPIYTQTVPGVQKIGFNAEGDRLYVQTEYGVDVLAVSP